MKILKKKSRPGTFLMTVGILLVLSAVGLAGEQLWEAHQAGVKSQQVIEALNIREVDTQETADYQTYPEMEMPTIAVDSYRYIGVLTLPTMRLQLPIMEEWDYQRLDISPCCFSGSAYTNDMIIAGHNYIGHFGGLHRMAVGDKLSFEDVEGHVFNYRVGSVETLGALELDALASKEWALTLFTCDGSGYRRVVIRCEKISA